MSETVKPDIVARLRDYRERARHKEQWVPYTDAIQEAADEIDSLRARVAELEARLAAAVVVGPLEWKQARAADNEYGEHWWAETIIGPLHVSRRKDGSCCWGGGPKFALCDSIDAGKEAAESHYRERLAPALRPAGGES